LVALIATVLIVGCASTGDEEPGRVVGKSSYTRPHWVGKDMHVVSGRSLGYLTHKKLRVNILELGIKQAQVEAKNQAVEQFNRVFADYAVGLVRDAGDEPRGSKQETEQWYASIRTQALQAAARFEAPIVKPESVYWEEVEFIEPAPGGGQEVVREYRIHVLVSFELAEISDRLTMLASKLAAAPNNRFEFALAAIDKEFPGLREIAVDNEHDKKDVEAIQTEMNSAGSDIDSSIDSQGPRGRKVIPQPGRSGSSAPRK
jgi:hypothetical protein